MGRERFERYLHSFDEEPPVSIRLNPMKVSDEQWQVVDGEPVPWCRNAYYLPRRPNFTMDPLLHAGCYYVQEAASMFLDEVLRQQVVNGTRYALGSSKESSNCNCLDLCAAPGGKSTLLRAALPEDSVLYSNEPVRQRASILLENVTKWGYHNHHVTNLYPRDYRRSKMMFDLILCDVPCSGEGMFRKDAATIAEWSPQNVEKCSRLQREIVSDAWACLNDGGLLVYSTCTFNTKENEENVRWMMEELGAQVLPVETRPEWNITGSLLEGFNEPVYRFIPGITRSEGLFMCILRKPYHNEYRPLLLPVTHRVTDRNKGCYSRSQTAVATLPMIGGMATDERYPQCQMSYAQAMAYLRHEALLLPENTPRGMVEVCFMGQPLGLVKNIGSRANNLYPKEWKIKTTHIPAEYEAILRHT